MSDPKPADVTAGDMVAEALARVLAAHGINTAVGMITVGGNPVCICGEVLGPGFTFAAHVAAALAPTVTAMVTAGQAEVLEGVARRIEARRPWMLADDKSTLPGAYASGLEDAAAVVREGGE